MSALFEKHITANTAIIIAKKMPAEKTTIYIPLPVSVITALKLMSFCINRSNLVVFVKSFTLYTLNYTESYSHFYLAKL